MILKQWIILRFSVNSLAPLYEQISLEDNGFKADSPIKRSAFQRVGGSFYGRLKGFITTAVWLYSVSNNPHSCLCTGSARVVQSRNTQCAEPVHKRFSAAKLIALRIKSRKKKVSCGQISLYWLFCLILLPLIKHLDYATTKRRI